MLIEKFNKDGKRVLVGRENEKKFEGFGYIFKERPVKKAEATKKPEKKVEKIVEVPKEKPVKEEKPAKAKKAKAKDKKIKETPKKDIIL